MMKEIMEKKNSRPAPTGTTAKNSDRCHYKYSTTKSTKSQVVIVILTIVILALLTIKVMGEVFAPEEEFIPVEHKVTYGDTLWSIAKEYKPDNMTMDRYMAWVYEHNDGGKISPGDTVIMAEVR